MTESRENDNGAMAGLFLLGLAAWVNYLNKPDTDGFKGFEALPISWETTAATDILRNAHALLRASDEHQEFNTIVLLLSTGVEKLLRVGLGHEYLREKRGWPNHLRSTYKHRLNSMNSHLLNTAKRSESAPPELVERIERLQADPVWTTLLNVLHVFANEGRFYFQDELAKRDKRAEHDPMTGWMNVMEAAHDALGSPEDAKLVVLRDRIEESFMEWWRTITAIARVGLLGDRGKRWADDIDPEKVLSAR